MTTYLLLIYYWITTELLLNYVITVLWTIRTSDPLLFMLDALANASRSRNKLRPRSPFSDEKNVENRTSTGCTAWNSALCTCAHTHACRKNRACAFLAGFRVVCCLFYRFPVRNALRASQAVHATDVMFNPSDRQVQKKPLRALLTTTFLKIYLVLTCQYFREFFYGRVGAGQAALLILQFVLVQV